MEIQIRGGKNIVKELEESLSLIEEIEGYLKIVRSFPLISLNFLKNLTIIHGKTLDNGKHAFIVRDNQNLQELWDWTTRREEFQIKRGKLFFHFNPKLCLYKIQKLRQVANLSEFTDSEVARDSNGDKVACNVTELRTRVQRRTSSAVIIEWEPFQHHDHRALLGYVLFYIEAPSQNITLYDGRDACGGDGWMVDDVSVQEEDTTDLVGPHHTYEVPNVVHILTMLKPFTQYAFYVKTYTIATEGGAGAQSSLHYFRTLPGVPSTPRSLKSYPNSSSEIFIQWQPPREPNGNITYYIVEVFWEKIDSDYLEQRDYCTEPLTLLDKKPAVAPLPSPDEEDKLTTIAGSPEGTCSCDKKSTERKEKDVQFQIMFEDFLHNTVYVRNNGHAKKKREVRVSLADRYDTVSQHSYPVREFPHDTTEKEGFATPQTPSTKEENILVNGKYHRYREKVHDTMVVIKQLRHYAEYTISVSACRDVDPEEMPQDAKNACSTKSIITARTLKLESADTIDDLKLTVDVANQTGGEVKLRWEEPQEPNGIVVTYHIEFKHVDIENYKPWVECITRKQFLQYEKAHTLKVPTPGNYSLRLRATSLAGNGVWTSVKYFLIQNTSSNGNLPAWTIVLIVVGGFFVMGLACYLGVQRRKRLSLADMKIIATVNPEYVSTVYVPDEWEVPRKKIELIKELGQGSFGMVYEGIARDIQGKSEIRCAIKTVGSNASDRERVEFLNEASVMKAFKTNHVVRLFGVVSQGCPNQAALVIMELMVNGDLKSYLRSHRPCTETNDASKQPPTLKEE
ncbi:hypothetical protein B566_EDAN007959 [Ephemera danica]|nr:hypothetical protein B566_EDAN007959 [Ephemera danica]